jgi:hypothetical protein
MQCLFHIFSLLFNVVKFHTIFMFWLLSGCREMWERNGNWDSRIERCLLKHLFLFLAGFKIQNGRWQLLFLRLAYVVFLQLK